MKRTRFVTFPRSGHHWLISLLQARNVPGFVYDEHHSTGNMLENVPHITAQKTHDFALDVEKDDDIMHVVQVRNYQDSIKSWCKIHGCHEADISAAANIPTNFRALWLEKWMVGPTPNLLIVRYEDLVANTDEWVDRVVAHIT